MKRRRRLTTAPGFQPPRHAHVTLRRASEYGARRMSDRRMTRLLPVDRWPTVSEAQSAKWFQPIRLGPLTAATRTWVPAMVPWRATAEGLVTPGVLEWYRRFAEGQPGVIVVEATGIRDVPSGPLLRAGHDRFIEGLSKLTQTVRAASGGQTKLLIQLIDFLAIKRRPPKDKFFGQHLELTAAHRAAFAGEVRLRRRLDKCLHRAQ